MDSKSSARHHKSSVPCYDSCVEGKSFIRNPPSQPTPETHRGSDHADRSALDLATINVAHEAIQTAIRAQCCQWEQESADAAADGNLTKSLMFQQWAFAADLLATITSTEFTLLFSQVLRIRFGDFGVTTRSVEEQMLDALALEVASAQKEPAPVQF